VLAGVVAGTQPSDWEDCDITGCPGGPSMVGNLAAVAPALNGTYSLVNWTQWGTTRNGVYNAPYCGWMYGCGSYFYEDPCNDFTLFVVALGPGDSFSYNQVTPVTYTVPAGKWAMVAVLTFLSGGSEYVHGSEHVFLTLLDAEPNCSTISGLELPYYAQDGYYGTYGAAWTAESPMLDASGATLTLSCTNASPLPPPPPPAPTSCTNCACTSAEVLVEFAGNLNVSGSGTGCNEAFGGHEFTDCSAWASSFLLTPIPASEITWIASNWPTTYGSLTTGMAGCLWGIVDITGASLPCGAQTMIFQVQGVLGSPGEYSAQATLTIGWADGVQVVITISISLEAPGLPPESNDCVDLFQFPPTYSSEAPAAYTLSVAAAGTAPCDFGVINSHGTLSAGFTDQFFLQMMAC